MVRWTGWMVRVHGEVDRVDGEGAWWWTGWLVRVLGGGQGGW